MNANSDDYLKQQNSQIPHTYLNSMEPNASVSKGNPIVIPQPIEQENKSNENHETLREKILRYSLAVLLFLGFVTVLGGIVTVIIISIRESYPGACTRGVVAENTITIKMRWETSVDLDLYVTQPDGTEVYYDSKVGNSGTLWGDKTGPAEEIYQTKCILAGTYAVQVKYHSGDEERVIAIVRAEVDEQVLERQISLSYKQKKQALNVFVTGNSTSGYEFLLEFLE